MRALPEPEEVSPADVEKWKLLLDETKIDDEAFLSNFTIRSKEPDAKGRVKKVQFTLLPAQKRLHQLEDEVEFGLEEYLELHVPKSRQHGVSSHTVARYGFTRILRRAGYVVTMTAHKVAATQVHRRLLRALCRQVDWNALAALGFLIEEDTAHAFAVKHPNEMVSRIEFLTARSEGLGRGEAPNCIISTERPHYPKAAKEDFFSILGGMATVRGNCWIDESTANGEGDEFHEDCKRARDGVGIGRLLFLAAYENPLSYRPFTDDAEHTAFVAKIGEPAYGDIGEEVNARAICAKYLIEEFEIDFDAADEKALQFLNWRRFKIDASYRGSIDAFHQEEPLTLDEAFLGSGRPVFDHRLLNSWADAADRLTRSGVKGSLSVDAKEKIVFTETMAGHVTVYRKPEKSHVYCFGNDVALGREFVSGTGKSADWTVITVDDARTGKTVAKLRAHITTPETARNLVRLARWYHLDEELARGLVELGGGYGDAVVQSVLEMDEGQWVGCLMSSPPTETQRAKGFTAEIIGFKASRQGKATLKNRGEEFLAEIGHYKEPLPGEPAIVSPFDRETLDELKLYSYDERGGMQASSGHDDCVIAKLLALQARWKRFTSGEVPLSSKVPKKERVAVGPNRRYSVKLDVASTEKKTDPTLGAQFSWRNSWVSKS